MTERILVLYLPGAHERHRLDSAVRMHGEAGLVVGGHGGLEVIEEQERIEMVEPARPDAAAQMHPRALHHRLWRDDLADRPHALAHRPPSPRHHLTVFGYDPDDVTPRRIVMAGPRLAGKVA